MNRIAGSVVALLASSAQAAEAPLFELGLRAGYAAAGNSGLAFQESFDYFVPAWLDIGVRVTPRLFVGAFGSYFIGRSKCPFTQVCSGNDVRAGIEAQIDASLNERAFPWLGLGAGYEWVHANLRLPSFGTPPLTIDGDGWEFVNIQAGLDFAVGGKLRIGPFMTVTMGKFSNQSAGAGKLDGATDSHIYGIFGFRGTFTP
jgi:hypothetical protein